MAVFVKLTDTDRVAHQSVAITESLRIVRDRVYSALRNSDGLFAVPLESHAGGGQHDRVFPHASIYSIDVWEAP